MTFCPATLAHTPNDASLIPSHGFPPDKKGCEDREAGKPASGSGRMSDKRGPAHSLHMHRQWCHCVVPPSSSPFCRLRKPCLSLPASAVLASHELSLPATECRQRGCDDQPATACVSRLARDSMAVTCRSQQQGSKRGRTCKCTSTPLLLHCCSSGGTDDDRQLGVWRFRRDWRVPDASDTRSERQSKREGAKGAAFPVCLRRQIRL